MRLTKADISPKCRWCSEKDETVEHLLSGCSALAKDEYLARHNQVATVVYWLLCKKYGIQVHPSYYRHVVQLVLETDKVKIPWDIGI